ncbi:MAG: hypothetical protein ACR2G5_07400 [Pyrinomonadaceae bacterium]
MKKLPANTDALLEPLLLAAGDEQADTFLSELITTHVEPVIKGVIRYKLHFNSNHAVEQAVLKSLIEKHAGVTQCDGVEVSTEGIPRSSLSSTAYEPFAELAPRKSVQAP